MKAKYQEEQRLTVHQSMETVVSCKTYIVLGRETVTHLAYKLAARFVQHTLHSPSGMWEAAPIYAPQLKDSFP